MANRKQTGINNDAVHDERIGHHEQALLIEINMGRPETP